MRSLRNFVAVVATVVLLGGCAAGMQPVTGSWFSEVGGPVTATSNTGSSKVGEATAQSILGLIGLGDATIQAAMEDGGITKIHHVDYKTRSILGLYAETTVYVYGE